MISKDCRFQQVFSIYYLSKFHSSQELLEEICWSWLLSPSLCKGEYTKLEWLSIRIYKICFHPFVIQKVTLDAHQLQSTLHCKVKAHLVWWTVYYLLFPPSDRFLLGHSIVALLNYCRFLLIIHNVEENKCCICFWFIFENKINFFSHLMLQKRNGTRS